MDKYYLFDNKICNNGVAMGNRSVVDSLNHLFKENQSLQKSISEQHNKIADLESKLAESEAIKKKYKTIFLDRFVDAKVEDARIWKEKYDQLKQQLAEKDAEIEELKKQENKEKQSAGDVFVSMFEAFEKLSDQQINDLRSK